MADIESNIHINVDTSVGISEIKALQRQISLLNEQLLSSGAKQAKAAQNIQRNLINNINATGQFAARVKTISSTTESFTHALERNQFSMGQYFKYAAASTKTFSRLFKSEAATIDKVATSRVKTLQTQYIKLGRDASGALKAISVRPLALDMDNLATKTALAAQRQQLFNQLIKQGSTSMLNFGKNTQWAGRQLMVGFTIPLAYLGGFASKTFMKMEEQAIRFKRVYGDMFTATDETDKMVKQVQKLAEEFTKYGVAVADTMKMAADAAAMGKEGADLLAQVQQAATLAVLGGVEQEKALETTISLTNAFGIAAEDLAGKINFLNAVENQTVTAIEDLTIAIPKAAPVIKQLGGNVEDLAFFLTAMKEGGINASEGANALKSGLASLINPTKKAQDMLAGFGINVNAIVEGNAGNVKNLVVEFAQALDTLDPLNRARAIEQMFGKFQFARISTLFKNVVQEGTQAQRVLQLTRNSSEELAILSERELKRVEDSPMYKFKKAVEDIKVSLVPLGEAFLKAITPVVEFAKGFLDKFNEMSDGAKNFTVVLTTLVAGIGPILLMGFGLLANGVANIIKLFSAMSKIFQGSKVNTQDLATSTEYMTQAQLEAAAVASSLDQTHSKLVQTFAAESGAVDKLAAAYGRAVVNQSRLLGLDPKTGAALMGANPKAASMGKATSPLKLSSGIFSVPGRKGEGDVVPAMLSPGEAVIPVKQSQKYAGLIQGMMNDNIPGFAFGRNPWASLLGRSGISVRMPQESFLQALSAKGANARYSSAFTTQSGADFTKLGGSSRNAFGEQMRTEAEAGMFFGGQKNVPVGQRPTYGYATSSRFQQLINRLFGLKGKQYNAVTDPRKFRIGDLRTWPARRIGTRPDGTPIMSTPYTDINPATDPMAKYGDIILKTRRSVAKRSSAAATDLIFDYSRANDRGRFFNNYGPAPMRGATAAQSQAAKFDQRLGNPFGNNPVPGNPRAFYANPQIPHVETYTPGGFGFKEISKIIVRDKAAARQLQKVVDQAGLRIRVTPQNAGPVTKMLANMFGTRFEDGVLSFSGKKFSLGSQAKVETLNKTIAMLQSKGISDERILARIENLYYRDDPSLTASKLRKNFGFTASGSQTDRGKRGSSAPENIRKLKSKFAPAFANEIRDISSYAASLGLTERQIKDLVTVDAAHLSNTRSSGTKVWNPKNLVADLGYVNKYISHLSQSKDSKRLLEMSTQQLRSMGIDKKEMSAILSGQHPTTPESIKTLQAIARWRTRNGANQGARLTSKVLSYGLDRRMSTGFYKTPMATLDSVMSGKTNSKPTTAKVAPKTPRKSPSASQSQYNLSDLIGTGLVSQSGRSPAGLISKLFGRRYANGVVSVPGPKGAGDIIPAMLSPGESVIPAKMSKKYAPLINGMIKDNIPGFASGVLQLSQDSNGKWRKPNGQFASYAEVKAFQASQAQPKRARNGSFGSAIGGIGMAAGTVGMGLMFSGNESLQGIGTAMSVGGGLLPMLPMLANPLVAVVAGLAAVAAGALMVKGHFDDLGQETRKTTEALGVGNSAMTKYAEFAGKVSATDVMDRKRAEAFNPFSIQAGKNEFGATFLQSEQGQSLLESIKKARLGGKSSMTETMLSQLSTAVSGGSLSVTQARSIAYAIGESLADQQLSLDINANLTRMFGPNGENLIEEPLKIQVEQIATTSADLGSAYTDLQNATNFTKSQTKALADSMATSAKTQISSALTEKTFLSPIIDWMYGLFGGAQNSLVAKAYNVGADVISPMAVEWKKLELTVTASNAYIVKASNALESYQSAVDALDVNYDKQIAAAKAAGDEAKAQELINKKAQDRNALMDKYSEAVGMLAKQFANATDATQTNLLTAATDRIKEKFKDSPDSLALYNAATEAMGSKNISKSNQFQLTMMLNADQISLDAFDWISNNLNQTSVTRVLNLNTKLTGKDVGTVASLLGRFGSNRTQQEFIAKFELATNSEQATEILNTFTEINNLSDTLGGDKGQQLLDFYVDPANAEQLVALQDNIQKLKQFDGEKLTIDYIQQISGGEDFANIIKGNYEYFSSLDKDQQIRYTQIIETMVLGSDPMQLQKDAFDYAAQKGTLKYGPYTQDQIDQYTSDYINSIAEMRTRMLEAMGITGEQTTPTTGTAVKDPYSDILNKLKQVRNAAIDAAGGLDEMKKVLAAGSNTVTKFLGTDQKLLYAGYSTAFIDSINSMDEETKKKFISVKNGVVKVTEAGKLLQKAYSEIKLGDFQFSLVAGVGAINKQLAAMKKLRSAGLSTADSFEIVQDEELAFALATATTDAEVKKIVEDFKRLKEAQKALQWSTPEGVQQWLKEYEGTLTNATSTAFEFIDSQKAVVEQDFATGTNLSGKNSALKNINSLNDAIKSSQELIAGYQYDASRLQYELSTIADQETIINKKYDERLDALDKIFEINSDIAEQQQAQLDISQSLASGDIAAAARAMQSEQQRRAQKAQDDQKAALEAARQAELDALKSNNNKTRAQLEQELLELNQKISKEQYDVLDPQQRSLELATAARDVALEAVGAEGYLGKTEEGWKAIETAARNAVVQSKAFKDSLVDILKTVPGISFTYDDKGNITGTKFDPKAFAAEIKAPAATATSVPDPAPAPAPAVDTGPQLNTKNSSYAVIANAKAGLYGEQAAPISSNAGVIDRATAEAAAKAAVSSGAAKSTTDFATQTMNTVLANRAIANDPKSTPAQIAAATKANINLMQSTGLRFATGGLVPKYMSVGGFARGTDTVPAMLTPGEFVMKRYAVGKYGIDTMKAINSGTYSGESVYNYSVNVSVKSDANPDDIASAVMSRIKQIDSQRIRSNRY